MSRRHRLDRYIVTKEDGRHASTVFPWIVIDTRDYGTVARFMTEHEAMSNRLRLELEHRASDAFERHRAADPHCTCNDCIDYHIAHTEMNS